MNSKRLQKKLDDSYNNEFKTIDKRISDVIEHVYKDFHITTKELSLQDVKTIAVTILNIETVKIKNNLEDLLTKKEQIEIEIEKTTQDLQESKYEIFHSLEDNFSNYPEALAKLHQIKLQSVDLYDILSEMVESAIITALEKDTDGNITQTTQEVIKEITFEAIKEGSLNTLRIRKILSTILQSAIDVAEASPNRADEILRATLKGMKAGLIRSIDRFKKRLSFMPIEAKHILIEDYDTIIEDLHQTDVLFSQVVQTQAGESSNTIRQILLDIHKNMKYDLQELLHSSKEAADIMKDKLSTFAKQTMGKADTALQSKTALEARRMGKEAWSVAKSALESAIKSAKDVMDKKEK